MADESAIQHSRLTTKQLLFLARKLGSFGNRSLLDVGGDGLWIDVALSKGADVRAIVDERHDDHPDEVTVGSPAGSIAQEAHSVSRILLREISVFDSASITPEMTIALANLLSCLKPKGRIVIPITNLDSDKGTWEKRFEGFPGRLNSRVYKTGLFDKLTLMFLFRGLHEIPVLEFAIDRKPLSRLEWHRLAREAVMRRQQSSAEAA